ncbi:hypothetical protein LTR17_018670 [Elasticomyces elasticus]|nr:hypothetical protein LTR17_018670 [Elasticomyces elasticus]
MSIIDPSIDFRYNIAYGYGVYWYDVPRRLGVNRALDAAVESAVEAHSSFCSRQSVPTHALLLYSKALIALRETLDNAAAARSAETLCAVMILLVSQALLDLSDGMWSGHCEGALQLLKARGPCNLNDPFETQLVLLVRGPIFVEGLFNEKIVVRPSDRQDYDPSVGPFLHSLNKMHDYMRRWCLLQSSSSYDDPTLLEEARDCYKQSMLAVEHWRMTSTAVDAKLAADPTAKQAYASAAVSRFYTLLVSVTIILCDIVSAIDHVNSAIIHQMKLSLIAETVLLMEGVSQYGPMGVTHVSFVLGACWIGAEDGSTVCAIEDAAIEHRKSAYAAPEMKELFPKMALAARMFRQRLQPRQSAPDSAKVLDYFDEEAAWA